MQRFAYFAKLIGSIRSSKARVRGVTLEATLLDVTLENVVDEVDGEVLELAVALVDEEEDERHKGSVIVIELEVLIILDNSSFLDEVEFTILFEEVLLVLLAALFFPACSSSSMKEEKPEVVDAGPLRDLERSNRAVLEDLLADEAVKRRCTT